MLMGVGVVVRNTPSAPRPDPTNRLGTPANDVRPKNTWRPLIRSHTIGLLLSTAPRWMGSAGDRCTFGVVPTGSVGPPCPASAVPSDSRATAATRPGDGLRATAARSARAMPRATSLIGCGLSLRAYG